jgi:hypothetical protein
VEDGIALDALNVCLSLFVVDSVHWGGSLNQTVMARQRTAVLPSTDGKPSKGNRL